ncbi:MAG: monovalent cation/H(+) antiporter subunit G [Firmicutes bacterium]|jgi:multicomponent Na+:H+ antiporter subunit G|nr:monovalent cation/H(+) antiporter subunit G [Bacillota bacterium]
MMSLLIALLLGSGLFFSFAGTVGLLRLPDVYCRLHATTKCDTLGAGLVLLAVMISGRPLSQIVKLLLILIFIWVANPTAAHILARAAYSAGTPQVANTSLLKEDTPCSL